MKGHVPNLKPSDVDDALRLPVPMTRLLRRMAVCARRRLRLDGPLRPQVVAAQAVLAVPSRGGG